jgi:hypothetical protein
VRFAIAGGERDGAFTSSDVARTIARLHETGLDARSHSFAGGHRLDDALLARIAAS